MTRSTPLTKQKSFLIVALLALFVFTGCEPKDKRITEGIVEYKVSFPFLEESVLKNVFPQKMVVEFNSNQIHGELKSIGGIVASEFVSNANDAKVSQLLKAFNDRFVLHLGKGGVRSMLDEMPEMVIVPTNETKVIAGVLCKKSIAEFQIDSVPPVTLYHTDTININNPNWFTIYEEMNDFLLGYEIEQYGMRMKLEATKIIPQKIEEETFVIPDAYVEIDRSMMSSKIDSLIMQWSEE